MPASPVLPAIPKPAFAESYSRSCCANCGMPFHLHVAAKVGLRSSLTRHTQWNLVPP